MDWTDLLGQLDGQIKQKVAALEKLQAHVQRTGVSKEQVSSLLDVSGQLLCDNNFKVPLKLLNCWESIAEENKDAIRPYVNALLPHVVERLGDNRQDVRQAACNLLLGLLAVLRPDVLMEKMGRFWSHKHWKVRHGLLQFVAEAVSTTGEAALAQPRDESSWVLHHVIRMVGDPESAVRDAAIECLEEVYRVYGEQLIEIISRHNLRPAHVNSIYARLQQLGADVTPAATASLGNDQSPSISKQQSKGNRAGSVIEEYDTATSIFAETVEQQPYGDSVPAPGVQGASRQKQQQLAAEESSASVLDSSRSWGSAAAAAGAAKAKRGGYKDGGGVSSDGALPQAQPLSVSSERELRAELESIASVLSKGAAAVDWEKRVATLLRLEGLVAGGAVGSYEGCFLEHLRQLRDPLLEQMGDRRSAVARQAAHTMEMLAAALGIRFEPYAVTFMTALFKALVITVQVVSESADAAAKGILHHCRTPKLVPCVCDILTKDKSAKLRKHCSVFLLQIVEEWEPQEYYHYLDAVEAAVAASAQDALGETRMAGRQSFAAYASQMPERAAALLRRFDSGLQQKLHEAMGQYKKGALLETGVSAAGLSRPQSSRLARPRSAGAADSSMGPPPAKPPRSSRIGGTYQRAPVNANFAGTGGADFVTILAPPAPASKAPAAAISKHSRKSVAGMPMRVPGPSMGTSEHSAAPPAATAAAAPAAPAAAATSRRRTSVMPQRVLYQADSPPRVQVPSGPGKGASAPNSPDSVAHSESSMGGASSVGTAEGIRGHPHGAATRLFQQTKNHVAHQHILQQHSAHAGSLSRTSTTDDLQLLNTLRDQQQQQYQLYQEQLAAQPSSSTVMSMAATIAAAGAGLAGVQQHQQRPATLVKAVAGVMANPKDWKERVDKMNTLSEVLMRQAEHGAGAEAYHDLEKALPKLLVASDDPHFKVSLAALAAVQVCINTAPHMVEPQLDKLLPLLFLKLCAGKQQVRSAAEGALQACALRLGADSLLPALVRSLDAMKQPAARVSVMEFCVLFLGEGKVAGIPSTVGPLRHWISKNIPLLLDKNPNVRQMAARALGTMYSIDHASVSACLANATTQEVLAVQRSLAIAEAKAAAEEQEEAAAAAVDMAGMNAEHIHTWAQRGHWGTQGGAISVSSSMDLSASGIDMAAVAGVTTGMADMGLRAENSHAGAAQVLQVTHQPAVHNSHHHLSHAREPLYAQQHLQQQHSQQLGGFEECHQQQHLHELPVSANSSPEAAVAAAGVGPTLRDVLGRPMPAGYSSMTPAAATPAAASSHLTTQVSSSGASACNNAGSAAAAHLNTTPFPAVAAGSGYNSMLAGQQSFADMTAGPAPTAVQQAPTAATPAVSTGQGLDPAVSSAAAAAAAAAATGDAGSQARHLTVLVHRLQSRPGEDVLAELAACAGTMCQQAWQDNFSKVLLAGLSAAQHGQEHIRELAFLLVLALAKHHSHLFEPVLDVVVQPLLQGCADESREVLIAAQTALEVLMTVMPPLRCAEILAHKLPSEAAMTSGTAVDGEVLCATIRCLQMVCRQMTQAELLSVAPTQLLQGIFAAFHHPRPDVRKAVVFCLVDMWLAAGEGLTPYLASLSTSQLKLLTIYYNRTSTQRQQQQQAVGFEQQQ